MPSDISVPQAAGGFLWLLGELMFKWVPGMALSLFSESDAVAGAQLPPITESVTVPQVVDFLQVSTAPGVYDSLVAGWGVFVAFSTFFSLVFGAFLVYNVIRIFQHRRAHYQHLEHVRHGAHHHEAKPSRTTVRWRRIQEEIGSESEQSWRLAILEADIMLNELLDMRAYRGETMAEKLRNVDRADFNTIDLAWEGHKFRNKIAHEGTALMLNQREARRIITLYEHVFREFGLVD